jgi:seryl-tRNA synthetase
VGEQPDSERHYLEFSEICRRHKWCRTYHLGNVAGHRAYYLFGELAELEQALIRLAVNTLLARDFQIISVPDILRGKDIENCGMPTRGERTQVSDTYKSYLNLLILFLQN